MRCQSMTTKRIAEHFGMSDTTIRAAINLAKEKLGIKESRPDAA
jgi:DNA-binding CsgD family transcriptional regulator